METRVSIDPRVRFVPVPQSVPLKVVADLPGGLFADGKVYGALCYLEVAPGRTPDQVAQMVERIRLDGGVAVKVVQTEVEDASLPAAAGNPALERLPSEVRPVVAELLESLKPELREPTEALVERFLSEAGI